MNLNLYRSLQRSSESKILLLVMDGLGGLPVKPGGPTELEAAHTPNLDEIAKNSICGLHIPIHAGLTPGSGPAHLALFGYDPIEYQVGRGALAAVGINFDLQPEDVAARGNFCTIDDKGMITDRRAGRIETEKNRELCRLLRQIDIPNVEIFIEPVKEYRFLLVMRGEGLSDKLGDTDPQAVRQKPVMPHPLEKEAEPTANVLHRFIDRARNILADHHPANMVLLRGFSKRPNWPTLQEIFGIRCAAVAGYPMYRGLSKLIGMDIIETGDAPSEEIDKLEKHWNQFDYFYFHVKKTDSAGEDGDFERKVGLIEEVDRLMPRIMDLKPDVLIVTGDHSTPAILKSHSWHPVPVLLYAKHCRPDSVERFGERYCLSGALGPRFPAKDLMGLAVANAQRLDKFGA
ncbi:MAG: 2,3-bisphosphoglycerate-independent phosphoglycerate mutase [Desulfobacterales bacterium]